MVTGGGRSRLRVLAAAASAVALLAGPAGSRSAPAAQVQFNGAEGSGIAMAELLPRLRAARYLIVGEVHGDRRHHAVQIELLRALTDAGVPVVVGMETFSAAASPELALWSAGKLETAPFYRLFEQEWSLSNWPAYRELLFFLRERHIPLAGLNGAEELIRRVAAGGLSALSAEERRGLPPGGCTVHPRYRALLEAAVGKGVMHEGAFRTFCEAQTLRDALIARNLERIAAEHPGRVVVGLTGLYHAWKPAVPAQLAQLTAAPALVLLPEEGPAHTPAQLAPEVDYLWRWRD